VRHAKTLALGMPLSFLLFCRYYAVGGGEDSGTHGDFSGLADGVGKFVDIGVFGGGLTGERETETGRVRLKLAKSLSGCQSRRGSKDEKV